MGQTNRRQVPTRPQTRERTADSWCCPPTGRDQTVAAGPVRGVVSPEIVRSKKNRRRGWRRPDRPEDSWGTPEGLFRARALTRDLTVDGHRAREPEKERPPGE